MKDKRRRADDANQGGVATPEKLKGKAYEAELERLHGELVKLQEWVKHKGLKACIVFEGRDGAGKGGAIKAITERVSPRVFRVVALPAAPAGGWRSGDLRPQLVQPRRGRAGHGILQ